MRLLFAFLLGAYTAQAAIAVVTHGTQKCNGGPCTTGNLVLDTTGATAIIATVNTASGANCATSGVTAFNDSRGNTWVKGTPSIDSTCTSQWRAYSPSGAALSVGAGHTFSAAGSFLSFEILALSGTTPGTDPLNKEGAGTHTASATSLAASAILCDNPDSIVVTTLAAHAATTGGYSATAFTTADSISFTSGQTAGLGTAYLLQPGSPATVTPLWSGLNSSGNMSTTIACYNGVQAASVRRKVVIQ